MPPAQFSLLRKTTRTRYLKPYLFFAEHKTPCHLHTCVLALSWAPHKNTWNESEAQLFSGLMKYCFGIWSENVRSCPGWTDFKWIPTWARHAHVCLYKTAMKNYNLITKMAHDLTGDKGGDKHIFHLFDDFTKNSWQRNQFQIYIS